MPLLLITTDPQLQDAVESRVHAAGLSVHVQKTAADASASMRSVLPDALLVDLPHRSRERLRLLDETRRTYPAANVPIVLLKPPHAPGSDDEAALHLNRVALPIDLDQRLHALIQAHQARSPGQPHPYALDTLARVWRQGLSGTLHLPHQIIPLCEGGVIDPDHLSQLEAALSTPGVRFEEGSIQGLGDWLSVGSLLWSGACARTRPGFLQASRHLLLKARPSAERAALLPLPEALQALLAAKRAAPIARLIVTQGLSPAAIEGPLEALILLGLYRLQPAPASRTPQRARSALQGLPPPSSPVAPAGAAALDPELQARLERRRLQREAEVLAEADEWTVLGLQPTIDTAALDSAGERQQTRYARLASRHADPEVRQSAQRILSRLEDALACLRSLQAVYIAYGEPESFTTREEVAFREGFAALQRRDLPRAHRCFAAAHDEQMQSPRNLAYLGWTRYQLEGAAVLASCHEMVQLSSSLAPHIPQTQLFLATLEADSGELERAEQRLSALIRRGGAPEDVHSLFRRVRQQLNASRGR